MNDLKTILCILVALSLVTVAPVAAADPDPASSDRWPMHIQVKGTCYDIDPWSTPPVSIYECPTGG